MMRWSIKLFGYLKMQSKNEFKHPLFKNYNSKNSNGITPILISKEKQGNIYNFYSNVKTTTFSGSMSTYSKMLENNPEFKMYPVLPQKNTPSKQEVVIDSIEKPKEIARQIDEKPSNATGDNAFMTWANFATTALVTSASILVFQSPIKTILKNYSKEKKFMPDYEGGVFGFLGSLYRGTGSAFTGSTMRSGYVMGTKNNKISEEIKEKENKEIEKKSKYISAEKIGYVGATAFGEIVITQIPESLSNYQKGNQLPEGFKWRNNILPLMTGGFGTRYASAAVGFASLFILEEKIAQDLPIDNSYLKHVMSGALSGMTSVFFTCPLAMLNQERELKSTFTKEGQLINGKTMDVFKDIAKQMEADPKAAMQMFVKDLSKQLPLRMVNTAIVYAIISGLGELLGKEPINDLMNSPQGKKIYGFFSKSEKQANLQSKDKEATPEPQNRSNHK